MTLQKREAKRVASLTIPANLDLSTLFEENFAPGMAPQFTRVKIPTGGGTAFTITGAEGDEITSSIEGAVLYHHRARGYWPDAFAGGTPPACSSLNGIVGTGKPGGRCRTCPFNEWGSDTQGHKGKACKEMHRIYILRDGEFLPLLLSLPPTSLRALDEFASLLLRTGLSVRGVRTSWSLAKVQNDRGIDYSEAQVQSLGSFDVPTLQKLRELSEKLIPYVQNLSLMDDEYVSDVIPESPSSQGPGQTAPVPGTQGRQAMPLERLMGTLQQTPEMRYTSSGRAVTSCWFQPDSDMKGYRVVAWEDQAELFNQLSKGARASLDGIWRPVFNAPDQQEFVIKSFAVQQEEDTPPDWIGL